MADETGGLRRCIGSTRFGIEPHEAPVEDFPRQPSQKDGLGPMCRTHWNQYTAGLARDAKARKAASADGTVAEASVPPTDANPTEAPVAESGAGPKRTGRTRAVGPDDGGQGDAG